MTLPQPGPRPEVVSDANITDEVYQSFVRAAAERAAALPEDQLRLLVTALMPLEASQRPTHADQEHRLDLLRRLASLAADLSDPERGRLIQFHPFGSYVSKIYSRTSDIDITMEGEVRSRGGGSWRSRRKRNPGN